MTRFSRFAFPKADPAGLLELMAKLQEQQATTRGCGAAQSRPVVALDAPSGNSQRVIDFTVPSGTSGVWTAQNTDTGSERRVLSGALGKVGGDVSSTIQAALAGVGIERLYGARLRSEPRTTAPLPAGARFETRLSTSEIGNRTYKVYLPSGFVGQALPVVVMLHGCTQNPDDFAAGTRMNAVAEEQTFLVVYPDQPRSANSQRCWNWFKPGDQRRGSGEPALIADIVRQVTAEFSADPSRVYAAGLSAGGAAASILAVTYPDLFAAVGVHSGLACGSARDLPSAFAAMKGNGVAAPGSQHRVPLIVFHGDNDQTVSVGNSNQVAAQGRTGVDLDETSIKGRTPDGVAFTRVVRKDRAGSVVLEQWVVHGAGHAWSGGSPAGSFTDPRGPDASREMARFFLTHRSAISK